MDAYSKRSVNVINYYFKIVSMEYFEAVSFGTFTVTSQIVALKASVIFFSSLWAATRLYVKIYMTGTNENSCPSLGERSDR